MASGLPSRRTLLLGLGALKLAPPGRDHAIRTAADEPDRKQHYVIFDGGIESVAVKSLMAAVGNLVSKGADRVHLVVASGGGSTRLALEAYAFLRALPVRIVTWNIADVQSSATILFLAGEERIAGPAARFMLHPLTWDMKSQFNDREMTEARAQLGFDVARFVDIYKERTSLSAAQIDQLEHGTLFLDANEALQAGLVQRVEPFRIAPGSEIVVVAPYAP